MLDQAGVPQRLPARADGSVPRSCSSAAKAVERELGRGRAASATARERSTSTCCCSATGVPLRAPVAPAPRGHEPPLRARAAARARSELALPTEPGWQDSSTRCATSRSARRRLVTPQAGGLPWPVMVPLRERTVEMDDLLELATFRGTTTPRSWRPRSPAGRAARARSSGRSAWRISRARSSAAASAAGTRARCRDVGAGAAALVEHA